MAKNAACPCLPVTMATGSQAVGPGPAILQATSFTLELGTAAIKSTIPSGEETRTSGKGGGEKSVTERERGKQNNQRERKEKTGKREGEQKRDVRGRKNRAGREQNK